MGDIPLCPLSDSARLENTDAAFQYQHVDVLWQSSTKQSFAIQKEKGPVSASISGAVSASYALVRGAMASSSHVS